MILTAGVIVMILVAMSYAGNIMNYKLAQNEFGQTKQFMQTTAQQLDDIAWTIGRTQTVTYSSRFGALQYKPQVLTYTVSVRSNGVWDNQSLSVQSGILLYNLPVSSYSMEDNYFERVPYTASGAFLLFGSSMPVAQVFCIEKLSMNDGSYLRVALVPTMRVLSATGANGQNYLKFYLPNLAEASRSHGSQALTLTGDGISKMTRSGVDCVVLTVTYPQAASLGFNREFFNFDSSSIILDSSSTPAVTSNSVVEIYVGNVQMTIGAS
ncbi:MAG: hypothetical protein NWE93_03445 [Candidatus Bathyarchaeota archaeon]|nr:hypothetical protein [Candidatus Bathyarchaeota archaeon]